MLIALNLLAAAVIVGGITAVIVHAVRIDDVPGKHSLEWLERALAAAQTENAAHRRAHAATRRAGGRASLQTQ